MCGAHNSLGVFAEIWDTKMSLDMKTLNFPTYEATLPRHKYM